MSKDNFKNVSFVTKEEKFRKPNKWRVLLLQVVVISGVMGAALTILGAIMYLEGIRG